MRLTCHWFGCRESTQAPCCVRCGAAVPWSDYGDGTAYVEPGLWWTVAGPILVALDRLARWRDAVVGRLLGRRCRQCGRRFRGPSVARWADLCSDRCHDDWLPF
jgi:hypothetical protein